MSPKSFTRCVWILAAAACALSLPSSAQVTGTLPSPAAPSDGLLKSGLLSGARLSLDHSMSFNYASGSFGSEAVGLWMSRLGYRVSDPLRVSVDVGAVLDPSGETMLDQKSFFLGGFNLEYRPSRHFQLNVSYVNPPPTAAGARAFGRYRGDDLFRPWTSFPGPGR